MNRVMSISILIFLSLVAVFGCSASMPVRTHPLPLDTRGTTFLNSQALKLNLIATVQKEDPLYSLSFNSTGRYLAFGATRKVIIWDMVEQREAQILEGEDRDIVSLAFAPDNKILAGGSYKAIEFWDFTNGQHLYTLAEGASYVHAIAFSPDGFLLASGSRDTETVIHIWNLGEQKILRRLTYPTKYADKIMALAFSPDGTWLASVGLDRTIRIWNLAQDSLTPHHVIFDPHTTPLKISFSPNLNMMASGTAEGLVILYDSSTGKTISTLPGHRGEVLSLIFSPDGKFLISAGIDKAVHRWEIAKGKLLDTRVLDYEVQSIQFTSDVQYVAALGKQGAAVFSLEQKGSIPPVIAILTPINQQAVYEPNIRLTGKVVDDWGVSDLKILVNGVLVSSGPLTEVRDLRVEGEQTKKQIILDQEIYLKVGPNQIVVTAYDREGLSRTEVIQVIYNPPQGDVLAVVVGISNYKYVEKLRYADKDAVAFYEYLVNDNQIPKDQVMLLLNEEATLQNIKDALGVELRKKARRQDTVIIYYAGHGAPEADRGSLDGDGVEKYLLPYDTDARRLYSTALPMMELSRIFSRLSAERVVLIMDTCYSGSTEVGARTVRLDSFRSSISDSFLDRVAQGEGRVIITASEPNEVSMEREDLGHGIFTYYLLESFSKGDIDGNGSITANEVFRYVSKWVPIASGQNQHPVKKGEERKAEIVLGKVKHNQP
ncbi:MAG: caspase family protein [Nitrospira sp.]|nr:caspase family protein [Nitrospira sp.]